MQVRADLRSLAGFAILAAMGNLAGVAQPDHDFDGREIKHVFVIALENHNWTQPVQLPGQIQQIYGNPNAPFINSLVDGTALVYIDGELKNISKEVSYATAYHNVLATPSGSNPDIHPSEPNYLWAEAGTNFGVLNDNDPFGPSGTNQNTTQHLTGLLQLSGHTWRSYQEDIDLTTVGGALTNLPLPREQWTSPIASFSGVFGPGNYLNASNATAQYNYACKHNPQIFFTDTNGGDDTSPDNPLAHNYAPLQQLAFDLKNDAVAEYNWITPDQYNDMHSSLSNGFNNGITGDNQNVYEGDNFLSRIVPEIMASRAYKDGGVIVLWWDETENDGAPNDKQDDFTKTLGEIVISPLAHPNVNGLPYASSVNYTHSSDLRTWQKVFHVKATGSSPYLGDAVNANDLSDLFAHGVIPKHL